jgi:hypothetical protein
MLGSGGGERMAGKNWGCLLTGIAIGVGVTWLYHRQKA